MKKGTKSRSWGNNRDLVFDDFIEQFSSINNDKNLFPKKCRTCGKKYDSLYRYIFDTEAKAQSMEDAGEILGQSCTMIYRNCSCGNTLVVTIRDETLPSIGDFWEAMRHLEQNSEETLKNIVTAFVEEWERKIGLHYNLVDRRARF